MSVVGIIRSVVSAVSGAKKAVVTVGVDSTGRVVVKGVVVVEVVVGVVIGVVVEVLVVLVVGEVVVGVVLVVVVVVLWSELTFSSTK